MKFSVLEVFNSEEEIHDYPVGHKVQIGDEIVTDYGSNYEDGSLCGKAFIDGWCHANDIKDYTVDYERVIDPNYSGETK